MLRIKRAEAGVYTEKGNCWKQSENTPLFLSQRGSILIGIIFTMVAIAILGAGMLSLTTTSTFQELVFNNNTDASLAAESGGRYASAVIRDAYATDLSKLNAINADQTFNMNNGSSFQITDWVQDGSNPETVTFTSIGVAGSGFMRVERQIKYSIQPADQSAGYTPPPPPQVINLQALADNTLTGSMAFQVVNPDGDQALEVIKDQGSGIDAEAYVFAPEADPNPFYTSWVASGGYSTYDVQVKVATGTLSGGSLINPPTSYANGVVFRGIEETGQQQKFLAVSFVRNGMLAENIEPPSSSWTTWISNYAYVVGDIVQFTDNNYYQCIVSHTSKASPPGSILPTNATYWTLFSQDKGMIMLWVRGSNHANGDGNWVAYKILDQTGRNFVIDSDGHIKNWSTLLVRVVEAASVKLTVYDATNINIGYIITGAGGTGTAKVFRKINDNDGKVVLLLNNISGGFNRPATVGTYATDSTWGYRARDNYIWVFYSDKDDHSSNETPLETSGSNDVRLGQNRGSINWPVINVQEWSSATDKFSLVQWENLNTGEDADIRAMGTGKEAGAIIRSDIIDPQTTRPGPYTNTTFPGEIGLVSLGGENDAFFDDLAYYIRGYGDGGGNEGSGSIIQYP